jgi:hypothetical protein
METQNPRWAEQKTLNHGNSTLGQRRVDQNRKSINPLKSMSRAEQSRAENTQQNKAMKIYKPGRAEQSRKQSNSLMGSSNIIIRI